ncbi:hypothetical protein J132_10040, partial [Termitomyces sp. J132]
REQVETILDSDSQIVCIALDEALHLGLTWDPDIHLRMESANIQVNESVGQHKVFHLPLLKASLFIYKCISLSSQLIVLMGCPFDTLTESNIQNLQDGSAIITIRDSNTGC